MVHLKNILVCGVVVGDGGGGEWVSYGWGEGVVWVVWGYSTPLYMGCMGLTRSERDYRRMVRSREAQCCPVSHVSAAD